MLRWERFHSNGWLTRVLQVDEHRYAAMTLRPGEIAGPTIDHIDALESAQEQADGRVVGHTCSNCPTWRQSSPVSGE